MRSFSAGICLRAAVAAALVVSGLIAASSASAAGPEFGFSNFAAETCIGVVSNKCEPPFSQAAAHPPIGWSVFKLSTLNPGETGKEIPAEAVRNVRVDVPAGLSTNPEAVPECSMAEFGKEVAPGTGIFEPSECAASTKIGVNKVLVVVEPKAGEFIDVPLEGTVYNLERPLGVPSEFGAALSLENLGHPGLYAHTLIEGGVSWHTEAGIDKNVTIPNSGDSHEFFKIHDIGNAPPLLESTLEYKGETGSKGVFLTLPSDCVTPQVNRIEAESYEGKFASAVYPATGELKVTGCNLVPFEPKVTVEANTTKPDVPDEATVVVEVPQNENKEAINSSALKDARVTLPEGMTLNPAAANGLEGCTDEQFGRGTGRAVDCPAGSQVGTVAIETPTLPAGALQGSVYVGTPLSNVPSSGNEYRIFINVESKRYGVAVQLEGKVDVNETTGQLSTLVTENPQIPFSKFILKLTNGNHTAVANPLSCGAAAATAALTPFTTGTAALTPVTSFEVACTSTPFALAQTTEASPPAGGSTTSFTLNLTREDGQQYLKKISSTLPAGLIAKIPSVTQCGEPLAKEGKCPEASKIGTVFTSIGSGPSPYKLSGPVYLTGPYNGAPFGMSIVVPATKIGPYDYGNIVTQASISINPSTTRVTVAGEVPTIVGGVPLRMKALSIAITSGNFMLNPTSCIVLATETTLTSTQGATDTLSTPFQATGCSSLAFNPAFSYSTNAYTTKRNGASLNVKVSEPAGNANMKSVKVTLPLKLSSRQSTFKQACPQNTFAADPAGCGKGAQVGSVKVSTPTLPGTLSGIVYFVSHGGAAFPDLDMVVKGDGVTVILVGNTNISKGITHTTFATLPDVPVNSFEMSLPTGEKSALAANGDFCKGKMYMPTTAVGQNGKKIEQKIQIHVAECPVRVLRHKVHGESATITAAVSSAGKLSTSGADLKVVHKKIGKAVGNAQIAVRLSPLGERIVARYHRLDVKVRVGFKSSAGAKRESKAFVKLIFTS
jgi:hypothetical protein